MVFDIPQHGIQAVANLCGTASSEGCPQRRILPNVSPAERQNVIFKLRNGAVILEVESPIRVAVRRTSHSVRRTLYVHSVGANFQAVVLCDRLPGHAPIGSQSTNIEPESCARVGLRPANVLRTVNCAAYVQMLVPHGVSAESGHILREGAINNGFPRRSWRNVGSRERESPRWSAVPQILYCRFVIELFSLLERLP